MSRNFDTLMGLFEPPVRTNSLYGRVRLARFAREDFSHGASPPPPGGYSLIWAI